MKFNNQQHSFHIIDPSPWPFLLAGHAGYIAMGLANSMHFFTKGYQGFYIVYLYNNNLICWWRDVVREGHIIYIIQKSPKKFTFGMFYLLFLKQCYFQHFFGIFSCQLAPTINIGCIGLLWLLMFFTFSNPLLNTCLLLTSVLHLLSTCFFTKNQKSNTISH